MHPTEGINGLQNHGYLPKSAQKPDQPDADTIADAQALRSGFSRWNERTSGGLTIGVNARL
jgi:hypothetical protein